MQHFRSKFKIESFIFSFTLSFCILLFPFSTANADTASDLKAKIEERNNQIKQLEKEIELYNTQVEQANSQAQTLQNTLKTLDLTQKKISTDLTLTERKITKTNLTITQIQNEITDIGTSVEQNKNAIASLLQSYRVSEDSNNIVTTLLAGKNIQEIWNDMETVQQVQEEIRSKSDQLRLLRTDLQSKEENLGVQKKELSGLKQDLTGKKQAVEETKKEKNTILAQTKNKEQAYKDLVKTTAEKKAQFEKDVFDYESQLNLLVDKSSYPSAKNGIISWPLDNVYITQKFGKTVGAEKLYVSGSHNGVDFRASVGTRVKTVLDGVVAGTGNTDAYSGCYSFGKWVMVKHPNGLSSIYGHLSSISVSKGQELKTGDIIGYSGNTGYSTGPHLHLGLYATQGVRIEKFVNSIGCKQAIIPLADIKAYLDPLAYLPEL